MCAHRRMRLHSTEQHRTAQHNTARVAATTAGAGVEQLTHFVRKYIRFPATSKVAYNHACCLRRWSLPLSSTTCMQLKRAGATAAQGHGVPASASRPVAAQRTGDSPCYPPTHPLLPAVSRHCGRAAAANQDVTDMDVLPDCRCVVRPE